MANELPQSWIADFPLGFDEAGHPMVPTSPGLARARLAERQAQPDYLDSLTNHSHPLNKLRLEERRGLQTIAARGDGALPATPKV